MDLKTLYTTQLKILWEWRGGRRALLKRLLITLVVSAIAFAADRLAAAEHQYRSGARRRHRRHRHGPPERGRAAGRAGLRRARGR